MIINDKHKINDITHTEDIINELKDEIQKYHHEKTYLITDSDCYHFCFPKIKNAFSQTPKILILNTGENFKTINSVIKIWDFLFEKKADKSSLIINLGGGIVTDIGGFAASTFKRGISFINVPTSLLAQVDASVGGKNGINYNGLKNQIGTINNPEKILISSDFLNTLNHQEFMSGFAEMIKHALIYDRSHFDELILFIKKDYPKKNLKKLNLLIEKSVNIKLHFVKKDPFEKNIRKILNFGHTFGHAFESYFAKKEIPLKHGEAVAHGMICDLILSVSKLNFPEKDFKEISNKILSIYPKIKIPEEDFKEISDIMKSDKKNKKNKIFTILLNKSKNPEYKHNISIEDIYFTLQKYGSL